MSRLSRDCEMKLSIYIEDHLSRSFCWFFRLVAYVIRMMGAFKAAWLVFVCSVSGSSSGKQVCCQLYVS